MLASRRCAGWRLGLPGRRSFEIMLPIEVVAAFVVWDNVSTDLTALSKHPHSLARLFKMPTSVRYAPPRAQHRTHRHWHFAVHFTNSELHNALASLHPKPAAS